MTDPDVMPAVVVLLPLPDPLVRRGEPGRPPLRRLKFALRALRRRYGIRCVCIRDPSQWELDQARGETP